MEFAIVVCFAVALLSGNVLSVDTDLHESEAAFESEFHKIYLDKKSEDEAAEALAKSENEINEQNEMFKEGKASFYEELNADSDIPRDLFEKEKTGYVASQGKGRGLVLRDESQWFTHPDLERLYQSADVRQTIPTSYDATAKGIVTPVKSQDTCGSCAAFAATGAHETCMLKAGARFNGLDLSEQYLVDCGYNPSGGMDGCNGADPSAYMDFFASSLKGQSVHEVSYPYLNTNPKLTCPTGKKIYNSGAFVSSALPDYYCDEKKLKTLVATYGAVVTGMYANDVSFSNYVNGVYDKCPANPSDHAVLVVGYGKDAATGLDYWLVKNSWGSGWGLNGYIKIKRGVGMCNIGQMCAVAKCAKTSGTLSDPPIVPPPPPVPISFQCDISKYIGSFTGSTTLGFTGSSGEIVSNVICTNGICRPGAAGPTNACMYICGQLAC